MQQVTDSSTIDDILLRVSHSIYRELVNLMGQFKDESDREQRTRAFKRFVLQSRRLIYQIFGLVTWSRKADTKKFFDVLSTQLFHLGKLTDFIRLHTDQFFQLTGELFFMFSREHELAISFEMLSKGRHSFYSDNLLTSNSPIKDLDRAVESKIFGFKCTQPDLSVEKYKGLALSEKKLLSCAIRGKLARYDRLPSASREKLIAPVDCSLDEGLLKISCSDFFVVFISLEQPKVTSDWIVIYFHIQRSIDPVDVTHQNFDHLPPMTRLDWETVRAVSMIKAKTLRNIISFLMQISLKERIRILTKKLARFSKSSKFIQLPKYLDTLHGVDMRVSFWNNEIAKHMSYVFRIFLASWKEDNGVNIFVELYGYDPNYSERSLLLEDSQVFHQMYRLVCKANDMDTILSYLNLEASPELIMTEISAPLVKLKATILEHRLKQCDPLPGMTIEIHPLAIVVALPGDVFIRFIIDTYSGKTLIDVLGLEYYRELYKSDLNRLADDLNSVERETSLLPYLDAIVGEHRCMNSIMTCCMSSVLSYVHRFPSFETLLYKLQFCLFFVPYVDYPLASPEEIGELSQMLMKSGSNCIAFVLKCWDVRDHNVVKMHQFRKTGRQVTEKHIHGREKTDDKKNVHGKRNKKFSSFGEFDRVKILYLFIQRKDLFGGQSGCQISLELSSRIFSVTAHGEKANLTNMVCEHFYTETASLCLSTNMTLCSISQYVERAVKWADDQFLSKPLYLLPRSFPQLILNQPINEARFDNNFSHDRFGVFVDDSEGIWVDLDDDDLLTVHFYTSATEQSQKWGVQNKLSICPTNILKAFKSKGLGNPVLYASVRLKLLKCCADQTTDADRAETSPFYLVKLEQLSIHLKEPTTSDSKSGKLNSNEIDAFQANCSHELVSLAVHSISLRSVEDLLRRSRLPIGFEWLTLSPLITSIRTVILLVWTTTYYAYKGYIGLDSDVFLRPICIDRKAANMSILCGLCLFESEEKADEGRRALLLESSRYYLASIPTPVLDWNRTDDDEEEERECNNNDLRIVTFQSGEDQHKVAFQKIAFEFAFDTLSELYQNLGK